MLAGDRSRPELFASVREPTGSPRGHVFGDAVVEDLPGARAELGHADSSFVAPPAAQRHFWRRRGCRLSSPRRSDERSRADGSIGARRVSRCPRLAPRCALPACLVALAIACAAPASSAGFGAPRVLPPAGPYRVGPLPPPPPARALRHARSARPARRELAARGIAFRRVDEARGVLEPVRLDGPAPRRHLPPGLPAAQRAVEPLRDRRLPARPRARRLRAAARRARRGRGRAPLDVPPAARRAWPAGSSPRAHPGARSPSTPRPS